MQLILRKCPCPHCQQRASLSTSQQKRKIYLGNYLKQIKQYNELVWEELLLSYFVPSGWKSIKKLELGHGVIAVSEESLGAPSRVSGHTICFSFPILRHELVGCNMSHIHHHHVGVSWFCTLFTPIWAFLLERQHGIFWQPGDAGAQKQSWEEPGKGWEKVEASGQKVEGEMILVTKSKRPDVSHGWEKSVIWFVSKSSCLVGSSIRSILGQMNEVFTSLISFCRCHCLFSSVPFEPVAVGLSLSLPLMRSWVVYLAAFPVEREPVAISQAGFSPRRSCRRQSDPRSPQALLLFLGANTSFQLYPNWPAAGVL